jgi:hypothetical protein
MIKVYRSEVAWYDVYSDDSVPPYEHTVIGHLLKLPEWAEFQFQAASPPADAMISFTVAELTEIMDKLQKLNRDGHLREANPPAVEITKLPFSLDYGDGTTCPPVTGRVELTPHSVAVYCDGYGHFNMSDGHGAVVGLSVDADGVPEVNVWGDITQEDVTHWESLAGADERLRLPGTETFEG